MATDAFGKLRVTEPFTTFNYYPTTLTENSNLDEDIWISGGNSQTYNSNNYINMPINTASTNYAIRQTKCPMVYQSGKSRLIYMTGVMMTSILTSTTSYIGLFNVDTSTPPNITEGMYFKCDGTNLIFEEVTQSATNTVNQSSWNIDTFDGTGPSGQTLTITNASTNLLIVFDQEWLGVGRIRCGFNINGVTYYAHQFIHSGLAIQYTKTPRLRLSYYIKGTVANTMRQMCSTNMSEGGYYTTGKINSISTTISGIILGTIGTRYILLALRINSTYPNGTIIPNKISMAYSAASNKMGYFEIQLHSTYGSIGSISGTLTYNNLTDSIAQYAIGNGTQTITSSGYTIQGGFVSSQSEQFIANNENERMQIRMTATQYDTIYVVGTGNTTNDTMYGSLTFVEEI